MGFEGPGVAFIYPPFSSIEIPALGISMFKNALSKDGIKCDIHYVNFLLDEEIGRLHGMIAYATPVELMLGEWLFAPSAFGENPDADLAYLHEVLWKNYKDIFTPSIVKELFQIRDQLPSFLDKFVEETDWSRYAVVGFSSSFQQHCASLALAKRIKSKFPNIQILFGGANCFGAKGEVLCRLFPFIDYVCTGEGDVAVPELIRSILNNDPIHDIPGFFSQNSGETCASGLVKDLDILPFPDYSDYFDMLKSGRKLTDLDICIPIETSRGCWWGEKMQCTFCGFNPKSMLFRCKSSTRVLDEIQYLHENYGNKIHVADNILAQQYFQTLIPQLADQEGIKFYWEVKASLTSEQVRLLACAGITEVQVGIESLNDSVLRLMQKGTKLIHNIQILKWGKQFGIDVFYNILWGFPGEDPNEYAAMKQLIPKIQHLAPPNVYGHIRFERFSAYWKEPARYGITSLMPSNAYRHIFHSLSEDDLYDIAHYFDAEYNDESEIYAQDLIAVLKEWKSRTNAALDVFTSGDSIRITDTRKGTMNEYNYNDLAADLYLQCDTAQTIQALLRMNPEDKTEIKTILDQFVVNDLMIYSDGKYLSLGVMRS
ncbi:MAG: RiPP maturation radical SAM C-methyltransferase [Methanomicrobiaceae archaeon]|nr:RiPP maturation radical SAM C-methyltransferase [Methanomicrobiaceae archaeon]